VLILNHALLLGHITFYSRNNSEKTTYHALKIIWKMSIIDGIYLLVKVMKIAFTFLFQIVFIFDIKYAFAKLRYAHFVLQ